MNKNANAIITLCSHLCVGENIVPLEPKEWGDLAKKLMSLGYEPGDLFDLSVSDFMDKIGLSAEFSDRLARLIDRNASLFFEIGTYENMGISLITRADSDYPAKLKKVLGNNCPPIFYCAGDIALLNRKCIGYVGSRNISDDDVLFTKETVGKTVANGYGVVSGGAKGIDSTAGEEALSLGYSTVEYLSDSMIKKIKKSNIVKNIIDKKLLLLSVAKPDAGFNVGIAMMRNRYIYAQSSGTVIVRSDYNKGGTWAGAIENLKYNWCKELCRNKNTYQGNIALIEKGAIPIDESWDGDVESIESPVKPVKTEQISLFDSM